MLYCKHFFLVYFFDHSLIEPQFIEHVITDSLTKLFGSYVRNIAIEFCNGSRTPQSEFMNNLKTLRWIESGRKLPVDWTWEKSLITAFKACTTEKKSGRTKPTFLILYRLRKWRTDCVEVSPKSGQNERNQVLYY